MSVRRQARLRREYLYRKSLEGEEKDKYEKKKQIREALQQGLPIPSTLRHIEGELRKEIQAEDEGHSQFRPVMDDEYARAGMADPKVLITTAHDPTQKLLQFAKELKLLIPNSERILRGAYKMPELVAACRAHNVSDLVVVHETRGVPDTLIVSHMPYGPTVSFALSNVVMRHDVRDHRDPMSLAYPHLVFENFSTPLGERVMSCLKYLFPVPKDDSRRVLTFANRSDYVSFRHHLYRETGHNKIELKEVGPRFELKPFQILLGTIDQVRHADVEWALRPYMNSAKRRREL